MYSIKRIAVPTAFLYSSVAVISLGLAGNPAWAQSASPRGTANEAAAENSGTSDNEIVEIVVTANRREENLQRVPIAISAVTAESAAQMGLTDAQSFAEAIPGLSFNRQSNTSIPFLRGVGTPTGESADENSVAFYVDDVYYPAGSAQITNFNNLESIEVDKGPQGTLFGRNATGGVVQVRTRDPSSTPSFDASAGYGNYDTKSGSIYATGGLLPTLSANIAIYGAQQSNGWGHEVVTGQPSFTGWDWGGRIKFLWQPSDATSVLFTVDTDRTRTQEGLGFHAAPGTGTLNPLPPYPNGGFPGPSGFYDTNENLATYSINRQGGASLKVTQDFDVARLVSITAWRYTRAVDLLDEDAGPLPLVNALINTPEHTWTQELQLQSAKSSKVTWTVGAFYYRDIAGFNPLQFTGAAFAPLPYVNAIGVESTRSMSEFAQAMAEVLPATRLTLGLRYTSDHRRLDAGADFAGPPEVPAPNSPQTATFSKLTHRIILDHQFSDNVMGYIGYNRGFKSGLFNPVVLPGARIDQPVQPETLDSYTAGAKTEFLDHRLRVNAEAFYYKYKNIQVDEILSGVTHITNAAAATIKGVDVDITAVPADRITLTASFEALDGHYTSFPNGQYFVYNAVTGGNCTLTPTNPCGVVPGGAGAPPGYNGTSWNLAGNRTIQSPTFSATIQAGYKIPTQVGPFNTAISYSHKGAYFSDSDNGKGQVGRPINGDQTKATNIVNASVSWTSVDEHWSLRAWGKNLTGQQYSAFTLEDAFTTQYSPAPPRTYGLTASLHF